MRTKEEIDSLIENYRIERYQICGTRYRGWALKVAKIDKAVALLRWVLCK